MADLSQSLYLAGSLARIQSILGVLENGRELEGDDLKHAIQFASNQPDNRYHVKYISPVLKKFEVLTLVGGDLYERRTLINYFKELRSTLISVVKPR